MNDKVYIIAEAGVNHNGNIKTAKELIDIAVNSGANAVKFQTFKADKIVTKSAPRASYQIENAGGQESQNEMLKRLELSDANHKVLIDYCKEKKIEFLSTPFDVESLNLLTDTLHLKQIKISSGDLTNAPLLLEVARKQASIILSTGMSTLAEVEEALGVLAFGYLFSQETPTQVAFKKAFQSIEGRKVLEKNVTLLHCVTNYPAPYEEVNLRAMTTMREVFKLPVGFSDHTLGVAVPIAAVAMGARVIEKHFTINRSLPGPDHKASLEPAELKLMIDCIRQLELALGTSEKKPTATELKVAKVARKSLVTSAPVKRGDPFTLENLTTKRPSSGMSPMGFWDLLGTHATRDYKEDEIIEE